MNCFLDLLREMMSFLITVPFLSTDEIENIVVRALFPPHFPTTCLITKVSPVKEIFLILILSKKNVVS